MVGLFADVKFASDDGLHVCMLGGIDEVDGAENISVVDHGHGRHPQFFYALAELFDITGAIEQGIVRMEVQVDELGHGFGSVSLPQPGQRKTEQLLWLSSRRPTALF